MRSVKLFILLVINYSLLIINSAQGQDRHVSVYYYPWYHYDRHWDEGYLRDYLVPAQEIELGEYSSRSTATINKHIAWCEDHYIDSWVCSWWGPESWEDETLLNNILPNLEGTDITFCLFYESAGILGIEGGNINFSGDDVGDFRTHFNYIAEHYFDHPNYLKVDGIPVVYLYLSRAYTGQWKQALGIVRLDMRYLGHHIYFVGDEVYWGNPIIDRITEYDAITAYNMHGQIGYNDYPAFSGFISDVANKYAQYKTAANQNEVAFIPNILPGFNDRGVRPETNHYIIPTQYHPDSGYTTTLSRFASAVIPHIDDGLNMVSVTSFNEWHEDTQIEPTLLSEETNVDISGVFDYTDQYYYKGYGTEYLQVLADYLGPYFAGIPEQESSFNLYPVPAKNKLNIELESELEEDLPWQIYNSSGKLLLNGRFKMGVFQKSEHIDIQLPQGIYIFKCGHKSKRFIVI